MPGWNFRKYWHNFLHEGGMAATGFILHALITQGYLPDYLKKPSIVIGGIGVVGLICAESARSKMEYEKKEHRLDEFRYRLINHIRRQSELISTQVAINRLTKLKRTRTPEESTVPPQKQPGEAKDSSEGTIRGFLKEAMDEGSHSSGSSRVSSSCSSEFSTISSNDEDKLNQSEQLNVESDRLIQILGQGLVAVRDSMIKKSLEESMKAEKPPLQLKELNEKKLKTSFQRHSRRHSY